MPHPQFDRTKVKMKPLASRPNKVFIERDQVSPDAPPKLAELSLRQIPDIIERIRKAKAGSRSIMLAHGAHTIKNCLAPVMIKLMEGGWLSHLATNGAGIIHDWEFAYTGQSSEDVRANVARGEFGNWEETGFYINLAINVGAYEGLGYGESVGAMIYNEKLTIPSVEKLQAEVVEGAKINPPHAAAAADLIDIIRRFNLKPGEMQIPHKWKQFSVQAAAFRLGVPYTGHPMIGHDIVYNHPMNHCPLLGRAAQRDFLTFAQGISRLDGGVYMSIGSAVMSPMIFEKSLSISQNVALQKNQSIANHFIQVVDLAESRWDWTQGEPPETNPDYYLRYNKTFNRMGGQMRYMTADNRDFLLALWQALKNQS